MKKKTSATETILIRYHVDTTDLDKAIKKMERFDALQAKLSKARIKIKA